MCRNDTSLIGNLEFVENCRNIIDGSPVGLAPHNNADDGGPVTHVCVTSGLQESAGLQQWGGLYKGLERLRRGTFLCSGT